MYQRKIAKMDLDKMLRHVNNLNDYISVTQEVAKHACKSSKVQFNMSTVLLLKKVRSLEIEYFNKCEGNGAALVLFERMVDQPASKTWGLLGKELVALLQYWLDAMRKHLIRHNHNWWTFLKLLLKFIKNIRTKDRSLPDILVEGITECLLDLATSSQPDILQRHEILCCLNLCCAESSREIRFALRNKFETFFMKLAGLVCACGHLPTQYAALEALLRWLLPRHDATVRRAAASAWFPAAACQRKALDVFLERQWQDFFQDARDFLNACNEAAELVTSVVCRKVVVGSVVVVSGTEKRATWLDVNSADRSVSLVLDPRLLEALAMRDVPAWETLLVPEEGVISVQLYRESSEVLLVFHTSQSPRLCPSQAEICPASEVKAVLSSAADHRRLDRALREVFAHKYQVLLDLDKPTVLSPQDYNSRRPQSSLEEDTRFSHPVEVQRRKHSGFIVRPRLPVAWPSPSTASTTSLAQLHEKLASLPQYKFEKEAVHVCALPELSTVTEISETDDRQSLLGSQILKTNRPYGVCQKNFSTSERSSQSDGEVNNKRKIGRYLSPIEKDDEHSTNCLLVATIGSADESVINDTLERLTKNKDFRSDNIVNLLVQEALQKDYNERELLDSGINTGDNATKKTQNFNEVNSEAIENTPVERLIVTNKENEGSVINKENERSCTVISNTTTDESNEVWETPKNFVNVRKRQAKAKIAKEICEESDKRQVFDVNAVEEFFSQHIAENKRGEVVISPTLARKINESSSESEQFDDCLLMHEGNVNMEQIEIHDIEIVECLNSMVDKVCSDLEKYTEIIDRETKEMDAIDFTTEDNPPDVVPLADISHVENIVQEKRSTESNEPEIISRKPIKLKYTAKKTAKTSKSRVNAKRKSNKLKLETSSIHMSPIKEVRATNDVRDDDKVETHKIDKLESPKNYSPTSKSDELDTPLARRKRKLYSPKYENIDTEEINDIGEDNNEFKASKIRTPKYKSTCYKEIETERKKRIRQPRVRKSKGKSETPSPRTKKQNEIFDQLKEKVECPVTVADKKTDKDIGIYNYTSDSEDEDFKKKKIEVQKRISSTTIASGDSAMSTHHGRTVNHVNYCESKSSDEANKKPNQKKPVRRKRTPRTRLVKPVNELIDEKMRKAAPEDLNTSIIAEKPHEKVSEEPKLILAAKPEMEFIQDEVVIEIKDSKVKLKNPKRKQKKAEVLSLKKEKIVDSKSLNIEKDNDDRTISPLPGLVIETIPSKLDDANDSVCPNMLEKLQKIHQGGPDEFINESNTTHNLLSDIERMNSPIQMNITDEFNKLVNDDSKLEEESTKSSSRSMKSKKKQIADKSQILQVKKEVSDKIKKKLRNDKPVVIDLLHTDTKSEKSIDTLGKSPITAHGDSDEAPPNSELLTQKVKPRDLEIEYLDQSTKDYYKKLRKDAEDLPESNKTNESDDSEKTKIVSKIVRRHSKERSPVVSITRLPYDDISKWLVTPRNSDTYSRCSEDTKNYKEEASPTSAKESEVSRKKSPDQELHVSNLKIQKLDETSEDDMVRRSKRKKTKPVILKYSNNEDISVKNTTWLRSHGDISNVDSSDKVIEDSKKSGKVINKDKKNKKNNEDNNRSTISPIRWFDEVYSDDKHESSTANQESPIVRQKTLTTRQESSDTENCDKEINNIFCHQKKVNVDSKEKTNYITKNAERSSEREVGKSAKNKIEPEKSRRKRKSDSPEMVYSKNRKVEEAVTISESGPSVSSINEWFRRNMPVSRAESMDTSLRDNIQGVLEKLDTTLAEIHQSTSKKFIHLFVDSQNRLAEMRRERRSMFKEVAVEILSQVASVVDQKFADLDRRSQEMHDDFTERLKSQASELIREDCRRKQVMVSLLREDLNATLARIDKHRASS